MKVPIIDDFVMTSDANNFILNQKMIVQEGENKGKEYLLQVGFYPSIIQALEAVLTKKMLRSTKRTLQTLVSEHTALLDDVRGLFPTLKRALSNEN